ncbi:ABC transporter substrate-binding protein [Microbacterium enclense]|nr:ABC transporter substrate-binding protein [Microbacterium enclense]
MDATPATPPHRSASRSRHRRLAAAAVALSTVTALLAACAGTAEPSGSAADGPVRFAVNWVPDVEWASLYVGDSEGYFEKEGVSVDIVHGGPNTPAVAQVLAAGQADIGIASDELQLIKANQEGADYVVIGAMYQQSPSSYTWLSSTPISTAEDLVGKRIGGIQGDQIRIDALFTINDLPADYTFVPMGYDPQPLVDGEVDVITSYATNQPIQLRQAGVDVTDKTFSDFGLKAYGDVIFASRKYLNENEDTVIAVLRGLIAATEANILDPSVAVDLTVNTYAVDGGLDAAFATEANAGYISLIQNEYTQANGILTVDPKYMENEVFAGYRAAGETDLPDVADFLDTSYMEAAHAK